MSQIHVGDFSTFDMLRKNVRRFKNASAENNENLPEGTFGSEMDGYMDQIITRIMTAGYTKPIVSLNAPEVDVRLTVEEIRDISRAAADSFMRQRSLIRLSSDVLPVTVVGDLHGQLVDLRKIISRCGDPSTCTYIFLGDYVDRGTQGLELAILLFCYQMRYPDRVFLLRGNHEDLNTTSTYGFYDECMQKYGKHGEWVGCSVSYSARSSSIFNEQCQILSLRQAGHSNKAIAEQLVRSRGCIDGCVKNPAAYGQAHGGGCPLKLTRADHRLIARLASNSTMSANQIRARFSLNVSTSTVLRAIRRQIFLKRERMKLAPRLTTSHREARLELQVYLALINAFNHLPLCAIIGEKVLCMHGGLSPHIDKLDDIEQVSCANDKL
ncbi:unnamed protein product [Haemonchus placei]|uniref:Serine/threonine-protein phosphatase n=1 Tax=Haemonchus placei TaxID=6290 RepID=A0A158QNY4_HAEPC|nr:unnamed protein product [Haemonchus placei]